MPAAPRVRVTGKGLPTTLMLNSEHDPATYYEGALAAHRALRGSRLFTVTGGAGQELGRVRHDTTPRRPPGPAERLCAVEDPRATPGVGKRGAADHRPGNRRRQPRGCGRRIGL
ncbi:alpha/beta hydrolase [Streptomyces sp. bgisy084]|uniref:alpha/beta hydrolase n=1 Tax=Streptomyces sp. bgisy084 TaxID=3413777 RepID=UPI003D70B2D2